MHTPWSPLYRKHKPSGPTTFPAQSAGQAAKRVSEEELKRVEAGRQVSLRPPDTFFFYHHDVHWDVSPSVKSLGTTQRGWKPQSESREGLGTGAGYKRTLLHPGVLRFQETWLDRQESESALCSHKPCSEGVLGLARVSRGLHLRAAPSSPDYLGDTGPEAGR